MNDDLRARVVAWMALDPDELDRATLQGLLDAGDEAELRRRFDAPLTFGTAGLRGPEMAGPAGMNRLNVRLATQGVVAWLHEIQLDPQLGVVVGRDARRGSERFHHEVVAVLLGAGVRVLDLPAPLPTPFVPYCVTALGAAAGIMITASHNPAQDNGYKLYAHDGPQIIPPDDEIVERAMRQAGRVTLGDVSEPGYQIIDDGVLERYRRHVLERFAVGASDLAITYTPMHGVGGVVMAELLERAGYSKVTRVAAQFEPDGAFPTVAFPNPEEPGALDLAVATARAANSALILANDPDADRLGAAVPTPEGWRILKGDEIGALLASALLPGVGAHEGVAASIVSGSLVEAMAAEAGVRYASTLTGFKWVARAVRPDRLAFGYEEALGFGVDPIVGDKDGLSAGLALAKLAHELAARGATLLDRLDELESRLGVHWTSQLSLRAAGPTAAHDIVDAVERVRAAPPTALGSLAVTETADLTRGWRGLPATEGIVLALGDRGRVVVRPSGTEPKVKAYVEITPARTGSLGEQRDEAARLGAGVLAQLESLLGLARA